MNPTSQGLGLFSVFAFRVFAITIAMAASPFLAVGKSDAEAYVLTNKRDARAAWEICFEVESAGVVERRTDSIYLIPVDKATTSERDSNRALIQSGTIDERPGKMLGFGHSVVARMRIDSIEVEIECDLSHKGNPSDGKLRSSLVRSATGGEGGHPLLDHLEANRVMGEPNRVMLRLS